MIQLFDINEQNWQEVASLSVTKDQQRFLDKPIGILARGYVYRSCNARVYGISDGKQAIGAALVKNLDEEPACYDLQQFMIDRRFQNKGYGSMFRNEKQRPVGLTKRCPPDRLESIASYRLFLKSFFSFIK